MDTRLDCDVWCLPISSISFIVKWKSFAHTFFVNSNLNLLTRAYSSSSGLLRVKYLLSRIGQSIAPWIWRYTGNAGWEPLSNMVDGLLYFRCIRNRAFFIHFHRPFLSYSFWESITHTLALERERQRGDAYPPLKAAKSAISISISCLGERVLALFPVHRNILDPKPFSGSSSC